jgi:hypothetical protein
MAPGDAACESGPGGVGEGGCAGAGRLIGAVRPWWVWLERGPEPRVGAPIPGRVWLARGAEVPPREGREAGGLLSGGRAGGGEAAAAPRGGEAMEDPDGVVAGGD